tara:strand:- start:1109 stop:3262 length:2154 start_codon:yes stop_codon:yes gene_type:complete
MVTVIRGANKKPVSSQRLAELFARSDDLNGYLYVGYPVLGTPEGPFPIDAIYVSPDHGVVLIDLVEGNNPDGFEDRQDDAANKLEAKFRSHKDLMKGRSLQVPVTPLSFAPSCSNLESLSNEEYKICDDTSLETCLEQCKSPIQDYYPPLLSIIQSISTIRKGRKKRESEKPGSRGLTLKRLEDSIANLDNWQAKAVIETVHGVQRIRGLAGSGKTIILALKAAYLHAQHPEWKIAVSFHTRSLRAQFKRLINTFVIEQTNNEPDWDNLEIIHSWGSPNSKIDNGIYYTFCKENGVEYLDYRSAFSKFGRDKEFEGACDQALGQIKDSKQIYDVILVDEAQDFPTSFLRICFELLKAPKMLVYAYDELQNLSKRSLPSPEEIFGLAPNGEPNVKFATPEPGQPKQDIILEKCYRNSRPILVTAHALGFGIYREPKRNIDTGLVQMFEQEKLWQEVGYEVEKGNLEDGKQVKLGRTNESSPRFLETHSDTNDIIQFHAFDTFEEQDKWLAEEIKQNLGEDELRADDIIVINPDPLTTRKKVGGARQLLFQNGINSHLAGVDTSPDVFFDTDDESIAFTGIFRAKGNEAGMVYIINAQDCFDSYGNLATIRNQLFTAITRSKAWVRVLGVGNNMRALQAEYQKVIDNEFTLDFIYPTAEQRKHLNIVNRDMTATERKALAKKQESIANLLDDFDSGKLFIEDLGDEQLERLRALLSRGS